MQDAAALVWEEDLECTAGVVEPRRIPIDPTVCSCGGRSGLDDQDGSDRKLFTLHGRLDKNAATPTEVPKGPDASDSTPLRP